MEENFTYKSRSRSQALPSCTLNVDYFKRLYQELSEITKEGANIEISQLKILFMTGKKPTVPCMRILFSTISSLSVRRWPCSRFSMGLSFSKARFM